MKKQPLILQEQPELAAVISAMLAGGGLRLFGRAFPAWNVPLYLLSMALLAVCFAMPALIAGKNRQRPHALRGAVIAGGVFLAVSFGAVFLVNNVLLRATQAEKATGILAVAFAAVFLLLCGAAIFTKKGSVGVKAVCLFLCGALLAFGAKEPVAALQPVRYEHPFTDKISETKGAGNVSNERKLLINADDSHWWGFWNRLAENGTFDDDSLNAYVMQYADSGVTDVLFNIFCQSSDVPSDVMTFRGDLYGQTEQHGSPVDYSNYRGLHEFYRVQHKDIFAVWFDKCRELGLRPWITLRMNDCHDPDEAASLLRGELFYTAEENGWTIGKAYGYYRHCLNYAVPEIRRLMLDYTREQLLRYDVFGLELDFMREIYCFDYQNADTDEIVGLMNQYMRDTAAIVKEAEAKWGHDVQLSVRMMRDLDQCRAYGFDPQTWCAEGLVDAICVTPRFSTNDSAMPIADWKARCKGAEIWAGVETLVNTQAKGCCADAATVRGYGAQYLTAGADGLYLFNYMSSGTVGDREREVYDTCGSLDEILAHPRRHIVTWQDTCPAGWEPYRPLPLRIKAGSAAELKVETGVIPAGAAVEVLLGLEGTAKADCPLTLTVNGRSCEAPAPCEVYGRAEDGGGDVANGYCDGEPAVYRFVLTDAADLPNLLTLTVKNEGSRTAAVSYAEVRVSP